jgi:vancomycin resistance protein VanJ
MSPKPSPRSVLSRKLSWTRGQLAVIIATFLYFCFLLWLWSEMNRGPEYSWLLNANLYLPQVAWAIPCLILLLLALFVKKKHRWFLAIPLAPLPIVFIPLMGLRGFPSPAQPGTGVPGQPLRVMTYNVGGGRNLSGLLSDIQKEHPDILLVQELGGQLESLLQSWYPDWNIKRNGEFVIATGLPVSDFERIEVPRLSNDPWRRPAFVRLVVKTKARDIVVYNTHLSTPRSALTAIRFRQTGGAQELESNSSTRLMQAHALAEVLIKEKRPFIVGGDFNAPETSLAHRQMILAGTRNAFSEAGKGYGYTYGHALQVKFPFIRIDHVFVSNEWAVESCHAGGTTGSDHRPMIADVRL